MLNNEVLAGSVRTASFEGGYTRSTLGDPVPSRLAELDLLRIIAATAVVFYHLAFGTKADYGWLSAVAKFGYLGVDLFFMISGFVILWSAQGRNFRGFAISRFCRLYPAFWLCIGATLLVFWGAGVPLPDWKTVLSNMTMVAGYLDQPYIDEVYWTLQVELKFYVIVGLIILLRGMPYIEAILAGWLAVCGLDVLFGVPGLVKALIIAPYGQLFIAGAVFYLMRVRGITGLRVGMVAICLLLSIPEAYVQSASYLFGQRSIVAPAILVGLYVMLGLISLGKLKLEATRVVGVASALTYPLYLLHNQIGRQLLEVLSLPLTLIGVFTLSYFVAVIDQPISGWLKRRLTSVFFGDKNKKPIAIGSGGDRL